MFEKRLQLALTVLFSLYSLPVFAQGGIGDTPWRYGNKPGDKNLQAGFTFWDSVFSNRNTKRANKYPCVCQYSGEVSVAVYRHTEGYEDEGYFHHAETMSLHTNCSLTREQDAYSNGFDGATLPYSGTTFAGLLKYIEDLIPYHLPTSLPEGSSYYYIRGFAVRANVSGSAAQECFKPKERVCPGLHALGIPSRLVYRCSQVQ